MFYREYQDQEGYYHAVYVIRENDSPETGLRVSLDFQPLAETLRLSAEVHGELWKRGVKTTGDYFVAGIYDKVVAALLATTQNRQTAKAIASEIVSHVRKNYGNKL